MFDYLRKFNNETSEHSEKKPARDLISDENSVVKAEIQTALSICRITELQNCYQSQPSRVPSNVLVHQAPPGLGRAHVLIRGVYYPYP